MESRYRNRRWQKHTLKGMFSNAINIKSNCFKFTVHKFIILSLLFVTHAHKSAYVTSLLLRRIRKVHSNIELTTQRPISLKEIERKYWKRNWISEWHLLRHWRTSWRCYEFFWIPIKKRRCCEQYQTSKVVITIISGSIEEEIHAFVCNGSIRL